MVVLGWGVRVTVGFGKKSTDEGEGWYVDTTTNSSWSGEAATDFCCAAQQIAAIVCCALAAVETCGNRARQQGRRSTLRIDVPNKIIAATTTAVHGSSLEAMGIRAAVVRVLWCVLLSLLVADGSRCREPAIYPFDSLIVLRNSKYRLGLI